MRKLLGGAVVVVGVGLLGWYATGNNAKRMQSEVAAGAQAVTEGTVHPVSARVSGRDITVSGIADGDVERDEILAAMHEVVGRRVVRDELRVLASASPFVLNVKKSGEVFNYAGMVPTDADREALAERIGTGVEDLELMAGAPDREWIATVDRGLDALSVLEDGELSVSDQTLTLTGTALTPEEDAEVRAALVNLPVGYEANFAIEVLDDGTPLRLSLDVAENGAVMSSGKVPSDYDFTELSAFLSKDVGNGIQRSVLPSSNATWTEASRIGASALGSLLSGRLEMTESSVTLAGIATPEGKAKAEAQIARLPEGISGTSAIELYDDGEPFSLKVEKTFAATMASGKFPSDIAAADIVGDLPASNIRNAFIEDDSGRFADAATKGMEALTSLEEGALSIIGTQVALSGIAMTPTDVIAAQSALKDLPNGYSSSFDISARDDGTPPNFEVTYLAGKGVEVSGKLPAGLEVSDIATALSVNSVSGDPVMGLVGQDSKALDQLSIVSDWLPDLDELNYNSNNNSVRLTATATPGVDQSFVQAGLAEALGDAADVSVSGASDLPTDGTTRTNQATGRIERFTSGFWLPVLEFTSDLDSCNTRSSEALQNNRISFVTGSAQLSPQSIRAINSVAAIIRKCATETGLNVEIGGHTDSQGSDELNQQLSQSRAEAVRDALISRGTLEEGIRAVGYGETQPIADNETEEGRAANRRTTINWFVPVSEEPTQPLANANTETPARTEPSSDEATDTETNTSVGE